jgi:hypothetical protein
MLYFAASVIASVLLPHAIEGKYSYDPSKENGPVNWSLIDIPGKVNQCGGTAQSGIDITTGPCDKTNANYTFEVRELQNARGGACDTVEAYLSFISACASANLWNAFC